VGLTRERLLAAYGMMCLIREFEESIRRLHGEGRLPGFMHVSVWQEAVPTGVSLNLRRDDLIVSTHRGHGDMIAKGAQVEAMLAEIFARSEGLCRGKGGSMHVADPSIGILGANAIVGAGMPLAVGAALSSQRLGQDRVAITFFGEGAVNQGAFHESINLAAIWDLPVVFLCENNVYAEFSDSRSMTRVPSVAERCRAYGVEAERVDGNDVEAVFASVSDAVERCRAGRGPALVEAETYRWHGHYEGDAQPYKPDDEASGWRARDPLSIASARLVAAGLETEEGLAGVQAEMDAVVEAAVEAARAADPPALHEAYEHVYRD
jgi:TPP-dependent pyruvate/acetoin dehydrogenase alpha subunit